MKQDKKSQKKKPGAWTGQVKRFQNVFFSLLERWKSWKILNDDKGAIFVGLRG